MENTQSEIVESLDSLKELNSKLLAQIDELRKENVNVKAENAKLKQALEEHESRFTNLERRDEEKSNTLAKLEYDVSLIKEESLQDNNTTSVSKEIPVSSETCQPIRTDPKSLEDKKIDDFLDLTEKGRVSNMMKERNREKRFRDQESIQKTSFSSENPTTEVRSAISHKIISQDTIPSEIAKIPYNQKVEQCLRDEFSVCVKSDNSVFDIYIPEFSLEAIIRGSGKITAQNIVDVFIVAMKTRQKEILCWYCYYKLYEDRIEDIKRINNIDDQKARTLVYNEIKLLLPDITDINLRQRTFKAKKIYILFMGVGIDRIRQVSISDEETKSRVSNSSIPLESSIDSKKILEAEISEEAKKMSLPESEVSISALSENVSPEKLPESQVSISSESKKVSGTELSIPPSNTLPRLFPFKKMLSKEERNQVINKLTMRFTDSPKLDKDYSIDKEGEHQSDSYWIFGSRCPICRGNHMSLQGNWWFDNRSKNIYYYLHCTNLKEPGISIDEVLEAYPENSKPIQELKTQRFTSPIPWNKALIFPNKNIAVEA
nr:15754_t:CDS:2 [Entrophospora candida]